MAVNDMPVIMYKILSYLYETLKAGVEPSFSDLQYTSWFLTIPASYWSVCLEELLLQEYITGLKKTETKNGTVYCDNGIRITFKGVEFLTDNSLMKQAKDFLGQSFQAVLSGIITGLITK